MTRVRTWGYNHIKLVVVFVTLSSQLNRCLFHIKREVSERVRVWKAYVFKSTATAAACLLAAPHTARCTQTLTCDIKPTTRAPTERKYYSLEHTPYAAREKFNRNILLYAKIPMFYCELPLFTAWDVQAGVPAGVQAVCRRVCSVHLRNVFLCEMDSTDFEFFYNEIIGRFLWTDGWHI